MGIDYSADILYGTIDEREKAKLPDAVQEELDNERLIWGISTPEGLESYVGLKLIIDPYEGTFIGLGTVILSADLNYGPQELRFAQRTEGNKVIFTPEEKNVVDMITVERIFREHGLNSPKFYFYCYMY